MIKLERILISGLAGTTCMTAASALMSLVPKEEFREPDQLKKLIKRVLPHISTPVQTVAAWASHYGMGFVFASAYVKLWDKRKIDHSLKNGLLLGLVSGLIGTLIWKVTFTIHPLPPNNRKIHFYLQRIPAHIIFALFATLAYRIAQKELQITRLNQIGNC